MDKVNKFRKYMAYLMLVVQICSVLHLCGWDADSWLCWVIAVPSLVGADWIVEKLDKIK